MARILLGWLLNAVALLAVAYLLPSVHVASFGAALVAALVLGLFNALIRPLLVLFTLPITLLTVGIFLLVINGLLFWAAGSFLDGFSVGGFWPGFFGALLYSLISGALGKLLMPKNEARRS
jgi:putative membrane protein